MGRKPKSEEMRGISRIDSNGTHGWFVRVYRNGKTYSKLYSDKKYGGKERALKIAKKARDHAYKTIPLVKKQRKKHRRLTRGTRRNRSGIVGVNRTTKENKKGIESHYYQVTWSPEVGKIKNKQWSVKKYGEKGAFLMAWEFRKNVMKQIHGEKYDWEKDITDWDEYNRLMKLED
jgi:hypothetical protein